MPRPCPSCCEDDGSTPLPWCCDLTTADVLEMTFLQNFRGLFGGGYQYPVGTVIQLTYRDLVWDQNGPDFTCLEVANYPAFYEDPPREAADSFGTINRTIFQLDFNGTNCLVRLAVEVTEFDTEGNFVGICYHGGQTGFSLTIVSCDPLLIDIYQPPNPDPIASVTRV